MLFFCVFVECYAVHRDLHGLTHSVPTRRSSDLTEPASVTGAALFVSCQANEPRCGAYLQGVLDMMIVARKAECRAPRYDRSALRAAYLRWAEQNSYFRSEEHTSELQSLMRNSYAVFCLKKKKNGVNS